MSKNRLVPDLPWLPHIYVSRRDKMRRFSEISHIELLVSVERYGNVVYHGEKSFRLS